MANAKCGMQEPQTMVRVILQYWPGIKVTGYKIHCSRRAVAKAADTKNIHVASWRQQCMSNWPDWFNKLPAFCVHYEVYWGLGRKVPIHLVLHQFTCIQYITWWSVSTWSNRCPFPSHFWFRTVATGKPMPSVCDKRYCAEPVTLLSGSDIHFSSAFNRDNIVHTYKHARMKNRTQNCLAFLEAHKSAFQGPWLPFDFMPFEEGRAFN